jgi:predicted phosphodiesterase
MQIKIKILSLSDIVLNWIYSSQMHERFWDVDLVLGCGDLPYYYIEFIVSALNVPTYFVRGNHEKIIEYSNLGTRTEPQGGLIYIAGSQSQWFIAGRC